MKVVVDIKGTLHENDILVYQNGQFFKPTSKDELLYDLKKQIDDLKYENEKLKGDFYSLKCGVNEKLENYHKILQTLTKEC